MRKRKPQSSSRLSESQLCHLVSGLALDGFQPDYGHPRPIGNFPFKDEDHRRRLYFENREFLLTLQAEKRGFGICGLFERPKAWWDYEPLPEPRRVEKKFFGFGADGWRYYEAPEGLYKAQPVERPEPEREYLARNGLLNEFEFDFLKKEKEVL